jgi:polyhydroxyalkanoate synthesis regulator phasin
MAGDELFKRYLEIGASVLGMSRERAESIVRDLVASGEVAKGQATKAADWLVERGRTGTEELAEIVRREIRQQVTAMGLATKDDIARLEAQLEQVRSAAANAATPTAAAAAAPRSRSARSAAPPAKAVSGTRAAKAAAGTRPAKAATGGTKSAGISRSGSVTKRPRGSSSSDPGAPPPAGGAVRPKG